jgi:FeS assembly protein IscX
LREQQSEECPCRRRLVIALPGFTDDSSRSNVEILEAIRTAWIEERK